MSQFPNLFGQQPYGPRSGIPQDYESEQVNSLALGRFFNAVYAWMCSGLALSAVVAWYVASRPEILAKFGLGGMIALFIAQVVLVSVIAGATQRLSAGVAAALFMLYAALNGVMLSGIFMMYSHAAIGSAFAITAGMFGAMSLYGFLTHKDLTGLGSMLFMALVGLVIASFVSIFWRNTILGTIINYVGVLIFTGLTAYDTQKLKVWAIQTGGNAALAARLSINGALTLYLDFINLFILILRIMSQNRRDD